MFKAKEVLSKPPLFVCKFFCVFVCPVPCIFQPFWRSRSLKISDLSPSVYNHPRITYFWPTLAPFCPPLGSVWPPLVPLWLPFGSHGAPFWLPSALLGTKPLHYTTARDTAGLWPMNLLIYKALFFLFTRLFVSTCHRLMPAFDHTAAIQSLGAVVAGDASSTSAMAMRYCCR